MFGNYSEFLKVYIDKGYDFIDFNELDINKNQQIILRHDIDFDINFALEAAIIESNSNIKATYFFLLKSNFYNILTEKNLQIVQKIKNLGHNVSIHFDPTIYDDFKQGLKNEIELFNFLFDVNPQIISLHRPNEFFLNYDCDINGVFHTYQSIFFKEIKYFSDSTGSWRFGNPIFSKEFLNNENIHLLIHPIWWFVKGKNNFEKLKTYFSQRINDLKQDFSLNSNPFKEISNEIK